MRKKRENKKRKLAILMDEECYRELKVRAARELKPPGRLVEEWVESWKKIKK
ncbi:MAG: hypothetical protein NTU69_11095 [Proteobacteria bacterium]|nr:hypothetical protein [Pseudomonadota bacterium]